MNRLRHAIARTRTAHRLLALGRLYRTDRAVRNAAEADAALSAGRREREAVTLWLTRYGGHGERGYASAPAHGRKRRGRL